MKRPIPPRLHVLLARKRRVGVVIRRGPSKLVCTVLWDRKTDTFTVGQWLKGRIYPYRSDLSPDGRHLIYFAMNGRWQSRAKGSWTAISRAPYLKAQALYAKGDCWHGGGLFLSDDEVWINDGFGHVELSPLRSLRRAQDFADANRFGGECPGVYFPRLIRDGWTLMGEPDRGEPTSWRSTWTLERKAIGSWTLVKHFHADLDHPPGRGVYWEGHALLHADGQSIECPDWEWADMDERRLVWAAEGRIHTGRLNAQGIARQRVLHDFNEMAFEALAAPY